MALVGMQDVGVGFGGPLLLEHIHAQIEAGERICLIGRNGAGKTTLMRLIAGELQPSAGILSRSPGLAVSSLAQEVPGGLTGTVFDQVSAGLGERVKVWPLPKNYPAPWGKDGNHIRSRPGNLGICTSAQAVTSGHSGRYIISCS
jgi:ABC-type Mn2+/Zn2+ transport system ATPase subunit